MKISNLLAAAAILLSSIDGFSASVTKKNYDDLNGNDDVVVDVDLSGISGGADTNSVNGLIGEYDRTNLTGRIDAKRDKTDLKVYRKVKDCWTWRNWNNPEEPLAREAPDDFLALANSPASEPIFFRNGAWWGAVQFWPNGKLKYSQANIPPAGTGEFSTTLNFAMFAYDETGTNEIYRFGATATRQDPTNETVVAWDGTRNQYVRIATTDIVDDSVRRGVAASTNGLASVAYVDSATNGLRKVDGTARPLPPYLHFQHFDDSYPDDAAWYYSYVTSRVGSCSARRVGNVLERNYDWLYDNAATFIVEMSEGPGRFASLGVASCGENLSEDFVNSGKWSRFYKCLPGRTVDGVNSRGVAINVNVVVTNGVAEWEHHVPGDGRDIDSQWAVRFVLDNAPDAEWAATNLANRVYISAATLKQGFSVHYAIIDKDSTWLVEDGQAFKWSARYALAVTNFRLTYGRSISQFKSNDPYGSGYERYSILADDTSSITQTWYTTAYRRGQDGNFPWPSEFSGEIGPDGQKIKCMEDEKLQAWAKANIPVGAPEIFPRGVGTWQTVHTSIYDVSNRTLRVAVQERDDWYSFSLHGLVKSVNGKDGDVVLDAKDVGALSPSDVVDNLSSSETERPLSANAGRELRESIDSIKARGRYLSVWNGTTGLPVTRATSTPYEYRSGDYFIVGLVGSTNYRPTGSAFTNDVPSTVIETDEVKVNDTYYFDGTVWTLLKSPDFEIPGNMLVLTEDDTVETKDGIEIGPSHIGALGKHETAERASTLATGTASPRIYYDSARQKWVLNNLTIGTGSPIMTDDSCVALSKVTNSQGRAVSAADVNAVGLDGSATFTANRLVLNFPTMLGSVTVSPERLKFVQEETETSITPWGVDVYAFDGSAVMDNYWWEFITEDTLTVNLDIGGSWDDMPPTTIAVKNWIWGRYDDRETNKTNYLRQADAAATYETKTHADETYAKKSVTNDIRRLFGADGVGYIDGDRNVYENVVQDDKWVLTDPTISITLNKEFVWDAAHSYWVCHDQVLIGALTADPVNELELYRNDAGYWKIYFDGVDKLPIIRRQAPADATSLALSPLGTFTRMPGRRVLKYVGRLALTNDIDDVKKIVSTNGESCITGDGDVYRRSGMADWTVTGGTFSGRKFVWNAAGYWSNTESDVIYALGPAAMGVTELRLKYVPEWTEGMRWALFDQNDSKVLSASGYTGGEDTLTLSLFGIGDITRPYAGAGLMKVDELALRSETSNRRYAMFIISMNDTSYPSGDSHFTQFELKASTNNFSSAATQQARCCFYSHSGHADGFYSTNDKMRLFLNHGGTDQRSYVRIPNTLEGMPDYAPAEVIVIVDASMMNPDRSDGLWLYEGNEDIVWTWVRTKDGEREFDADTDHCLWRPIAPVRWFSKLPAWAE